MISLIARRSFGVFAASTICLRCAGDSALSSFSAHCLVVSPVHGASLSTLSTLVLILSPRMTMKATAAVIRMAATMVGLLRRKFIG